MVSDGLSFGAADVADFDPGQVILRLLGAVALPLLILFALTLVAAVAAPAVLGSLGFRTKAFAFKGNKINPLTGMKRMFGLQGLIELAKSIAKVILLGGVGAWLIFSQTRDMIGLSSQEIGPALANVGHIFTITVLVMAGLLVLIALIDVPAQIFQRMRRLRMTKQEVKDEHKQTEGSPELKAALRSRQIATARNSARTAVAEATVVLTNPTHFAVALRYRPEMDAAPVVRRQGPRRHRRGDPRAGRRAWRADALLPAAHPRALLHLAPRPDHPRGSLYGGGDHPRLRLQPRPGRWPRARRSPTSRCRRACASTPAGYRKPEKGLAQA